MFPEGDAKRSPRHSTELRDAPELRRQLADAGRAVVERLFSVPAATDPLERCCCTRHPRGCAGLNLRLRALARGTRCRARAPVWVPIPCRVRLVPVPVPRALYSSSCLATIASQVNASADSRAARPSRAPQRRIGGEPPEALGDRCGVRRDQEAVLPVTDELANAVDGGDQDRQTARRRLEGHQREGLVARGQHKRVGQLVDHLDVAHHSQPVHGLGHTKRVGQFPVARSCPPPATTRSQSGARTRPRSPGAGPCCRSPTNATTGRPGGMPSVGAQRTSLALAYARRERLGVDPVVDSENAVRQRRGSARGSPRRHPPIRTRTQPGGWLGSTASRRRVSTGPRR